MRLAVAAGRDELARTVTAELEEGARRSPAASAAAAGLLCRGLVERDPDLPSKRSPNTGETPLRPDLAASCEDAAGLLVAADRRDEAIALLHEAATIHDEIDAAADAARVDGSPPRPRSTRTRRRTAAPPSAGNH